MGTPQHRIGSGFGARSTATEVLAGIDLSGRYAVVTGGYSGLGLETTRALAGAGAAVLVPARRPEHAAQVLAEVDPGAGEIAVEELDLADQQSVRELAQRMLATGRPID